MTKDPIAQEALPTGTASLKGVHFTDRYQALGIPYPNPETMCKGQCEGTGWVPHKKGDYGDLTPVPQPGDEVFDALWDAAQLQATRGTM